MRWVGLLGIAFVLATAWALSTDRRRIPWRAVGAGLALQLLIALLVLRTPWGRALFGALNDAALAFIGAADAGIEFVFGRWPQRVLDDGGEPVELPYVFATRVLPVVIFMSSVFAVLQHWGWLRWLVDLFARVLRRLLATSGAESLATAANVLLGMTEAPLMIRPWVAGLTRSELFCVMTAGMATVAGSVLVAYVGMLGPDSAGHLVAASFMSAPAAIAIAKLMLPEQDTPATAAGALPVEGPAAQNTIDAAASGAAAGVQLALNIGAMLIAFVAIVHLLDGVLGWAGALAGIDGLSLGRLLGAALAPLAWLLGVPWADAPAIGQMLGVKTVLNEFVAYEMLAAARESLDPRSVVIATYALCGFANLGSLAVLIGGLGGIAPERRGDVARDGPRAILAGSLATFLTGAIAGLVM